MEKAKWILYSAAALLSRLLKTHSLRHAVPALSSSQFSKKATWVYCTTIGELNACKPFLDHLYREREQLVFLTDRDCYRESYLRAYPKSMVIELTGEFDEHRALLNVQRPEQFYVLEIPCALHDAPCRLSYGILRKLKQYRVPIFLVNGWLYDYSPGSGLDRLEHRLFSKDYLNCFDRITVQSEAMLEILVSKGLPHDRICCTGNMKFDSVADKLSSATPLDHDETIVALATDSSRQVLVAGCLADEAEFLGLLETHKTIRGMGIPLVSILAPRHPENSDLMTQIEAALEISGWEYVYRSRMNDIKGQTDFDILVLDTYGELQSFFYSGDVCYMGRNHNILEPLGFGKPVFTLPGWEKTYPSYPVYRTALEQGLIHTADTYQQLPVQMAQALESINPETENRIKGALIKLAGVTEKNIHWIEEGTLPTGNPSLPC